MGKLTFGTAEGMSYQPKEVKVNTSGSPICPRCSQRVYFNEEKRALGMVWHKKCFSCARCKKSLDSTSCNSHEKEIYCNSCHRRLFGPKGYGFAGGAAGLSTDPAPYKPKTPTYTAQQKPDITDGAGGDGVGAEAAPTKPVVDQSSPDCCPRCGKKVYFAEEIKALSKKWHKLCFKCVGCRRGLEPGRCNEHEGDPYCEACYSRRYGPRGYGYAGGAGNMLSSEVQKQPQRQPSPTPPTFMGGLIKSEVTRPVAGNVIFSGVGVKPARTQPATVPYIPEQQQQFVESVEPEKPNVQQYEPPVAHYGPPMPQSEPTKTQYEPPVSQYEPPVEQYQPPVSQYEPPVSQYEPPVSQYEPPVSQYEPPVSQYEPPVSQYEPQVSQYEPPVSQYEPPVSQYEPPVSQYEPPVLQYEPPVSQYEPPVSQYEPQVSSIQPHSDEYVMEQPRHQLKAKLSPAPKVQTEDIPDQPVLNIQPKHLEFLQNLSQDGNLQVAALAEEVQKSHIAPEPTKPDGPDMQYMVNPNERITISAPSGETFTVEATNNAEAARQAALESKERREAQEALDASYRAAAAEAVNFRLPDDEAKQERLDETKQARYQPDPRKASGAVGDLFSNMYGPEAGHAKRPSDCGSDQDAGYSSDSVNSSGVGRDVHMIAMRNASPQPSNQCNKHLPASPGGYTDPVYL